jgi:RES domain-containing protein
MLAYRIVHKQFSNSLNCSGIAGRWNLAGQRVLYAADSIPLAFLENMIRRQGVGFNEDFKIMVVEIPDNLPLTTIEATILKTGWRSMNQYAQTQLLGSSWFVSAATLVLKVPSAVLPSSYNLVMNSTHPSFSKIKLLAVTDLVPDERIEAILKQQKRK